MMTYKHFIEALATVSDKKRLNGLCLTCGDRAGELIAEQDDEFLIQYVDAYLPALSLNELEGVAEHLGRYET